MSTEITLPRRTLRIRHVAEKTGIGESSIWRLVPLDLFPQPIKLSPGCTVWFEHEIDEWLDAKGAQRKASPEPVEGGTS